MHFGIWESRDGQFYWELVGDNGEIVAVSETYTKKESAQATIKSVKGGAGTAEIVDHADGRSGFARRLP